MKHLISADQIVRLSTNYVSKFFSQGWGDIELLKKIAKFQASVLDKNQLGDIHSILENTEIKLFKVVEDKNDSSVNIFRGQFVSPLTKLLPHALPLKSEIVNFEVVMPSGDNKPAMCIHLAGTGDHHFWWRKKSMAIPLANEYKIGSILLENPYYGQRKPKNQVRSSVNYVSDIFVMGCALLVESITLFLWCQKNGFGPLGITGISMGGHMATVASSGWNKPLAIVPCLSWTSAAPIYTQGVLYGGVHWKILEDQLLQNPEYQSLIRNDDEFTQLLQKHYKINFKDQQSTYDHVYNKITNVFSSIDLSSSISKKIVPDEVALRKYVEPIQKQILNPSLNNLKRIRELFSIPSNNTLAYMTALMDQATHLAHFNKPHKDSAIIYVVANHDKYINRDYYNVTPKDVWPQTEIRTIDCGHVLGFVMHQKIFRDAIYDAFKMLPSTI
ncbi:protein ABHD18 [Hydra vulgaris]|uniref:protein ABHD18 n=1 Tax=Hydra vulgaris TaxID=6087 RepID=UPI0001924A00|nr:protein ABHD18 [Hydra vulgaris]